MKDAQHNYQSIIVAKVYPAIREALILFIIAAIIAILVNVLRPAGIPLLGFSSASLIKEQQASTPIITISEAHDLFLKKKAVFVDARDPLSFADGHISGAINIYPDEVSQYLTKLQNHLSADSVVVTYCDGPQCPLSKQTGHGLLMQGVPVVKVLVDGWSVWQNAGYPTAKGNI